MTRYPITFLVLLLCLVSFTDVSARPRRSRSNRGNAAARIRALQSQATANIANASRVLQGATIAGTAAAGKMDEARGIAGQAADHVKSAKDSIKSETQHMHDVEDSIANAQPQDSEFMKALDAYEDASDDYQDIRESILNSKEYKIRFERANAAPNYSERQQALDELHYDMFTKNREYTGAVGVLESSRSKFERIRMDLLTANSEWTSAAQAVREARVAEADSKDRLTSAGLKKMDAHQKLNAATAVANQAKQVIASNQAVLNSLPKQKSTSSTSSTKKK